MIAVFEAACQDSVAASSNVACRYSNSSWVSYSPPVITSLSHPACQASPNSAIELQDCSRDEQLVGQLIITGSSFFVAGATVLIGTAMCEDVIHTIAHEQITCTLPSHAFMGAVVQASVLVIQGGKPSRQSAQLSYTACPRLTGPDCQCDVSYFAIPCCLNEDLARFQLLHPEEASLYEQGLLDPSSSFVDRNKIMGFWCSACPEVTVLFVFVSAICGACRVFCYF